MNEIHIVGTTTFGGCGVTVCGCFQMILSLFYRLWTVHWMVRNTTMTSCMIMKDHILIIILLLTDQCSRTTLLEPIEPVFGGNLSKQKLYTFKHYHDQTLVTDCCNTIFDVVFTDIGQWTIFWLHKDFFKCGYLICALSIMSVRSKLL